MNIMTERFTGHLILVMGPTGSGKGSILSHVLATFPDVTFAISCTTRPIRPGEVDGKDYHFVSEEQFQRKIDESAFLEWAEFGGHRYGSLKSEIIERLQHDQVVINEIELQGVLQLLEIIPKENRTLVFIDAGDWETSKARALARAPISEEQLALRYERYVEEIKSKPYADIVIANPDGGLKQAQKEMEEIVRNIVTHKK